VDVTTAAGSGGRGRLVAPKAGGEQCRWSVGGLLDKASEKWEVARKLLGSC
jgi:hypothetical protein